MESQERLRCMFDASVASDATDSSNSSSANDPFQFLLALGEFN